MKNFTKTATLAIAFLACHGCALVPAIVSDPNKKVDPAQVQQKPGSLSTTPGCLSSLPNLPIEKIRKNESSENVEVEGDELEEKGQGREALDRYSEAQTLYFGELGYASGRALFHGDLGAAFEVNTSIGSPEFLFKIGRTFSKTGQYQAAINCFTESLEEKIASPNDAIAYLNRGDAYERMGIKAKAKADFQQATTLFKKYKQPTYQKVSEQRLEAVK
jgi:tetratricopeptide (TPR) repeat protein